MPDTIAKKSLSHRERVVSGASRVREYDVPEEGYSLIRRATFCYVKVVKDNF